MIKNNRILLPGERIDAFEEQSKLAETEINYISEDILISEKDCDAFVKSIKGFIKKGICFRGYTSDKNTMKTPEREKYKLCDDILADTNFVNSQGSDFRLLFDKVMNELEFYVQYYATHVNYTPADLMGISYKEWLKLNDGRIRNPYLGYEVPKLRRYRKNVDAYNKAHYDKFIGSKRCFAGILYLNTIKDGGETVFPVLKREIKPVKGKFVIFPSYYTHLHYSKPSKKQDRFNIIIHVGEIDNAQMPSM